MDWQSLRSSRDSRRSFGVMAMLLWYDVSDEGRSKMTTRSSRSDGVSCGVSDSEDVREKAGSTSY